MLHRAATIGVLLFTVSPTAIHVDSQERPAFRSGVDVVSLNVTVTDPNNSYITDLAKGQFVVYEDGIQQEVSFFNRSQLPISMVLLIDTSASMENKLRTAQQAAVGFASRLRHEDTAEIIDFDDRTEILSTFTNDFESLSQAIRQTSAGGSTSLYNAIYISLKELRKIRVQTPDALQRQAIIVLSDGEDTSSLVDFEEVLDIARRSETSIYSIGLRSQSDVSSLGFREADFVLRQLSKDTGGQAFFPQAVEELASIYETISEELSNQYALGYTSNNPLRDGMWRRVVVRVDRSDAEARTKQGYYAPAID